MRLQPNPGDDVFQVNYLVTGPVDQHPIGPRFSATFAKNWIEASHMIRNKYGEDLAGRVVIMDIFQYERDERGCRTGQRYFYERYPRGRPIPPMPREDRPDLRRLEAL